MSVVGEVEADLRNRMLRGELLPGTRCCPEEIAGQLGSCQEATFEALQRLIAVGLLERDAVGGVAVPRITSAQAVEMFALRRAIEPVLLSRAMPSLTVADLAEAEMAASGNEVSVTLAEANWAFHRALYRPSNWDRGLMLVEILYAAAAPYVEICGHVQEPKSRDGHAGMLDAVRRGDEKAALETLRDHLDLAESVLVGFLGTEGSQDL